MHEYNDYFYTSTFGHFPYPLVTATDPYTLERIDTEDPRAKTSKITDVVSWRCLNDCPPHDQTLLEWFVQGVIALDSWLSLMKRPNLLEREDVLLDDTGTIQLSIFRKNPQRPLPPRAQIFTENLQSLCVLFQELHQETWLYPYHIPSPISTFYLWTKIITTILFQLIPNHEGFLPTSRFAFSAVRGDVIEFLVNTLVKNQDLPEPPTSDNVLRQIHTFIRDHPHWHKLRIKRGTLYRKAQLIVPHTVRNVNGMMTRPPQPWDTILGDLPQIELVNRPLYHLLSSRPYRHILLRLRITFHVLSKHKMDLDHNVIFRYHGEQKNEGQKQEEEIDDQDNVSTTRDYTSARDSESTGSLPFSISECSSSIADTVVTEAEWEGGQTPGDEDRMEKAVIVRKILDKLLTAGDEAVDASWRDRMGEAEQGSGGGDDGDNPYDLDDANDDKGDHPRKGRHPRPAPGSSGTVEIENENVLICTWEPTQTEPTIDDSANYSSLEPFSAFIDKILEAQRWVEEKIVMEWFVEGVIGVGSRRASKEPMSALTESDVVPNRGSSDNEKWSEVRGRSK